VASSGNGCASNLKRHGRRADRASSRDSKRSANCKDSVNDTIKVSPADEQKGFSVWSVSQIYDIAFCCSFSAHWPSATDQ